MMFKGKTIFDASFDVFAEIYHSVRPGYPAELYKDIRELGGLDSESRLLEIGAGSGIATRELAKLGGKVVAIEPGSHLAAIARKQTEAFKNVEILEGTFEGFESPERFNGILAFTAFHWLKGEDRYERVLNLLKDSGSLVLVWNWFFQSDSPATDAVNDVYHELLTDAYPEQKNTAEVNEEILSILCRREQRIIQNTLFYPAFMRKYLIEYNYNADTYPKLLNTYPRVMKVEEQKRLRFLKRIAEVVAEYGKISVPVFTSLIICKRKDYLLEAVANSGKET